MKLLTTFTRRFVCWLNFWIYLVFCIHSYDLAFFFLFPCSPLVSYSPLPTGILRLPIFIIHPLLQVYFVYQYSLFTPSYRYTSVYLYLLIPPFYRYTSVYLYSPLPTGILRLSIFTSSYRYTSLIYIHSVLLVHFVYLYSPLHTGIRRLSIFTQSSK